MNLDDYVSNCLELNSSKLASFRNPEWYAHLLLGLVEELLELYLKATELEDNVKSIVGEAGDVLAYATLITAAHRFDDAPAITSLVADVASVLSPYTRLTAQPQIQQANGSIVWFAEVAMNLAGKSKRWFRERAPLELAEVGNALNKALVFTNTTLTTKLKQGPVDFSQIAAANIQKLQDRAERNVLFSGSGDNR
jgi:NTP pyrophosphatase (non-canonical NTP hydrolase)